MYLVAKVKQAKDIGSITNPEKEIDKIYEENFRFSNELNTAYHNAIIKSMNKSLNSKYEGKPAERIKAIEKLSLMFTHNRQFGFRLASPFTIFELTTKGKFSNEHLKESVKYKTEASTY